MAKLRNTVRSELNEILDSTVFTSDDFDVTFGEGQEALVYIKLKYAENLYFTVSDMPFGGKYLCEISPGELYDKDSFGVASLHEAFKAIPDWAY